MLFSDEEATRRMVSQNKEADQTVKTQHFPTGKTLTGFPSNANIYTSILNKNSESEQKKGEIMAVLLTYRFWI